MFRILLKKEFREQWRTHRLLVVAVVLLFFGLTSPLLARYMSEVVRGVGGVPPEIAALIPPPRLADAVGQYLKNLGQFGVVLALLIPMGAVVQEKERGTAAMLFSKPVTPAAFLLAKFIAIAGTFLTGLFLAAVGGYCYTGILFQWLDVGRFALLNGLLLLDLLVYLSLTLLGSTLMRSQAAAAGTAFAMSLVLWVGGALPRLGPFLPDALLGWGSALVLEQPAEPLWGAVGVSLGLIAAALVGAWAALRRQEI